MNVVQLFTTPDPITTPFLCDAPALLKLSQPDIVAVSF
jgi:hypothetical protein